MSNRYWIIVGAIAVAAGIAGVYVARMVSQPAVASLESGTMLSQPRTLAEFSLLDARGVSTSPRELRGHPTLVFFGFTHCPDVCPTTLALLTSVQKQLAGRMKNWPDSGWRSSVSIRSATRRNRWVSTSPHSATILSASPAARPRL